MLVSSHVLTEVERFAENILVIVNGKLAAAGDYRAIREKIDAHPHAVRIRADNPRRLAAALINQPVTRSIRIEPDGRIIAETADVRAFYRAVPKMARQVGRAPPRDPARRRIFDLRLCLSGRAIAVSNQPMKSDLVPREAERFTMCLTRSFVLKAES